jgi:hypothetical protein
VLSKEDERIARHWELGVTRDMVPSFIKFWKDEAINAINNVTLPEDQSLLYVAIGLAANTLVFASMFFPGTAAVAAVLASGYVVPDFYDDYRIHKARLKEQSRVRANQAALALGNTLNIISQLPILKRPGTGLRINAKAFLRAMVAAKADKLEEIYNASAYTWVCTDMIPHYHILEANKKKLGSRYADWTNGSDGHAGKQRQAYVWDNFVFQSLDVPYAKKHVGMMVLMQASMQEALEQFNRQWREWFNRHRGAIAATAMTGGALGSIGLPSFEAFEKTSPFEPQITLKGVPADVQSELNQRRDKTGPHVLRVKYGR